MKIELAPLPTAACTTERNVYPYGDPQRGTVAIYTPDQMRAYAEAAVLAERERCAQIADRIDAQEQEEPEFYGFAREVAAAIRSQSLE